MKLYWLAFKLGLQNEQTYRIDLFMRIFKYAFSIIFLSVVWIAVGRSAQGVTQLQPAQLVSYYLASATLFGLSNFHIWFVEEDIKLGGLSKLLIKPVSPFWMYFCQQASATSLELLVKAIVFIPVIMWLGGGVVPAPNLILFLAYLPIVFYCSFSYLFALSTLSFWLTEVYALRWGWFGILRFISGVWVPLSLFPEAWQRVSFYLPFAHLVYTPAQLLRGAIDIQFALQGLGVLLAWSIFFTWLRTWLWQRGLLAYEGTGA